MAHPFDHARSSAKRWGGIPEDYEPIHRWFDASKEQMADQRHRALRHHTQGIFEAERVFGVTITNSDGTRVKVREVGEQHVREDLGWIPGIGDWYRHIQLQPWMRRGARLHHPDAEETQ